VGAASEQKKGEGVMEREILREEDRRRGVVAMSGGVDSSVAAALLVEEGHEVVGISMRLYEAPPTSDRSCCSPDDLFDARHVASGLGIPFYVANYVEAFQERVIDYFVQEYRKGRTPNPCVACNNHLKFDVLLGRTRALGGAWLATGHYARVERVGDRWALLKGVDPAKDQSYFLYGLPRALLGQIRFPLGALTKEEVRAMATARGLTTAQKPESQEICFVTGTSYRDFVKARLAQEEIKPGRLLHQDGRVMGTHEGVHQFTVGQRKGLGLDWHETLYVLRVDARSGDVVVGPQRGLEASGFEAQDAHWLRWEAPPARFLAQVKIRYRAEPEDASVEVLDDGRVRVTFDQPQRAVAPGQVAVFYDGDEVLGGAVIELALP
jgi:tRNA-specific 2-thiouridylase